jgi:transposase
VDAQINLSVVASDSFGVSGRQMLAALIAGERDPELLAQLARGRMRAKRSVLAEAFTGFFTDQHGFLLAKMLARVDGLDADIAELDRKLQELIVPFGQAVDRLDEIGGVGRTAARLLLAEIGTDMGRFPRLATWPRGPPSPLASRSRQPRPRARAPAGTATATWPGCSGGRRGRRQTDTLLGERYRRIARRRGTKRAIVAVGRSILVIVWHLLSDPTARFHDLGPGSTTPASTPNPTSATTSASSKRSATRSPSTPPPDRHPSTFPDPAPLRCAGCCRLPTNRGFPDQDEVPGPSPARPTTTP